MNTNLSAILIVADDKNDLWPLERPRLPFSCLPFLGGMVLLEAAWHRLVPVVRKENIWFLCPPAACSLVAELLPEARKENIIPNELGTLAAVHTLSEMLREQTAAAASPANPPLTIVTRTAMIAGDEDSFIGVLRDAVRLAQGSGCLIACGVPAREARAGYDYIIAGDACVRASQIQGRDVRDFMVNTDQREAQNAYQTGNAWWNIGLYVWPIATFLSEYAAVCHEFADAERRETCSLEDALLSRTKNLLLFGAPFIFNPLRNYEDIARYLKWDAAGNMKVGNAVLHNTESCFAYNASPDRLLVVSGLKDILFVQTKDAVFVCPRGDERQIRLLVEELAKNDPRIRRYIE
jgi:mannose-1-phosphate guanylyltransferase